MRSKPKCVGLAVTSPRCPGDADTADASARPAASRADTAHASIRRAHYAPYAAHSLCPSQPERSLADRKHGVGALSGWRLSEHEPSIVGASLIRQFAPVGAAPAGAAPVGAGAVERHI